MLRSALAALAAALLLAIGAEALAQTPLSLANTLKTFVAVDAVELYGVRVAIRGMVQGESAPSTWAVQDNVGGAQFADSCQRAALLAMARPGQYVLEIQQAGTYGSSICRLTRAVP